jgi:SAM-dependent methyltransferase
MDQSKFEWTPDFWQSWRESDNPYRQYKSRRDRHLVLKLLELQDGDHVLEIGCGYGWISQALLGAAEIKWFGVDQSLEMVRRLQLIPLHANARALVADAVHLPFHDGSFDKVLCTGVLMHIEESELAVRELVRVLRPGGRMVCSINNAISPYSLLVRLWNQRKRGFVQEFRFPGSFRKILSAMGVESGEFSGDGIVATVPVKIGSFEFPPARIFPRVCKLDEWAVNRLPWLAYEVWFSGVKVVRPCTF